MSASESRRRQHLIVTRVDDVEKQIIQAMADTDGKRIGTFLRDLAMAEHRRRQKKTRKEGVT